MKKKAFIVFTDLDGTFTPMGYSGLKRFVNFMKKIQDENNVIVKFCAISGRPVDYVEGIMDMVEASFNEIGLDNVGEYASGELGGILAYLRQPYVQKYLGKEESLGLKAEIKEVVKKHGFDKFLLEQASNQYSCSFTLKTELIKKLSKEEQIELITKVRKTVESVLGDRIHSAQSDVYLEIAPVEICKKKALETIIDIYQKEYNIVGLTYSGDSENDRTAVDYFSRLAEIKGIKSHVILPSNTIESLETHKMEGWKDKLVNVSEGNKINKAKKPYFDGIVDVLEEKYNKGQLLGRGIKKWQTRDDMALLKNAHKYETINKLEKWLAKEKQVERSIAHASIT